MLTDTIPVTSEPAAVNEVTAIEAMIDEGGPVYALPTNVAAVCPTCGRPKREFIACQGSVGGC